MKNRKEGLLDSKDENCLNGLEVLRARKDRKTKGKGLLGKRLT